MILKSESHKRINSSRISHRYSMFGTKMM